MSDNPKEDQRALLKRLAEAVDSIRFDGKPILQKQIAEDMGYKRQSSVSEIFNGKAEITNQFVKAFCAIYGISEKWLRGESTIMKTYGPASTSNAQPSTLEEPGVQYNEAWARIDKAVQAATEAAQAATRLALLIESRLSPLEARTLGSESMILGIEEFLVEHISKIENADPALIGAELSSKVSKAAERLKKGTQSGAGILNRVS